MNHKCTIRVLDEVNCVLVGLHPDHLGYFYEKFAAFAPNHFFNPKFKLGVWDGKIRFFQKTGKTYVNLLDEIIPSLIGLKYQIQVDDKRSAKFVQPAPVDEKFFSNIIDGETGAPWIMRDYQVEMINALVRNNGGIGICGTGGGKTSMCAALALMYERSADMRSIIIVPDKNLTAQTLDEYHFFGVDAGEFSGSNKDTSHQHVVGIWAALKNTPHLIQEFDVVIVDECHGVRGQVLTKLLNEYGKDICLRFGVTGTLPKAETDAMAVRIALGKVQYNITAATLIADGHLAKMDIDVIQLQTNFDAQYDAYLSEETPEKPLTKIKFKDSYFPDYSAEKRFLQTEKDRLQWIANDIVSKRDHKKGNVLCLVDGVNFGRKIAALIPDAVFLSGKDKMKERKLVYKLFSENDNLVVIATVHIASTGLNIKRIFNLMFIDVGKSFIRVIQTIGRGLRKAPDKDYVAVTDICSDLKYGKRHMRERTAFYDEAQYPYKKKKVDYTKL